LWDAPNNPKVKTPIPPPRKIKKMGKKGNFEEGKLMEGGPPEKGWDLLLHLKELVEKSRPKKGGLFGKKKKFFKESPNFWKTQGKPPNFVKPLKDTAKLDQIPNLHHKGGLIRSN